VSRVSLHTRGRLTGPRAARFLSHAAACRNAQADDEGRSVAPAAGAPAPILGRLVGN